MSRALFIVSTGRTGTTFFGEFFREMGVRSFHEPGPRWLRFASNAYVSGNMTDERAHQIIRRVRATAVEASSVPYVEASCFLYGFVRPILDTFDDARVVHVVRDPRSFIRSGMNWGMYRFAGRVLNLIPYRRLAEPHFAERFSVSGRLQWALKSQFERLCWAWPRMNRAARVQGEGSGRFLSIRYEDIFDRERGYPGLRQICSFAGIDVDEERLHAIASAPPVNATERRRFPEWRKWPAPDLREMLKHCTDEACRYGYDLVSETRPLLERVDRSGATASNAS